MQSGAGAVDGFDSFALCGWLALEVSAVVCLEKSVSVSVVTCVVEVRSFETAGVIEDAVEKLEPEDV